MLNETKRMKNKANCSPTLRNCIMQCLLILGTMKLSLGISDSCPVSPSTVKVVDDCPDSEEKWREAAAGKNCGAYASQCDEPDKLVYHCVINEYANKILEVCAYGEIIVLGHCTEYNLDVNKIQQNFRTNCTQFTPNPCPSWYYSYEAYKYQGCYELTKQKEKEKNNSTSPAATDTSNKPIIVVFVLTIVALVAVVIATCTIIRYRVKKKAGCFGCLKKEKKQIISTTIQNHNDEEKSFKKESALKNEEIVKNEVKMDQDHEMFNNQLGGNVSLRMGDIRIEENEIEQGPLITPDAIH